MTENFKNKQSSVRGDGYWISPDEEEYYIGDVTHESWMFRNHRFNIGIDENIEEAIDNGWIRLVINGKDFNFETREKYLHKVEDYLLNNKFDRVYIDTDYDNYSFDRDEWIDNNLEIKRRLVAKKEKHILQFTSSTELKQAIKLLKSLIYHNFNYEVGDNCLIFVDFNSYDSAKQLFNNKGYSVLDKKAKKKPTIAIDFDGVIHGYSEGWKDGEIYDKPVKGVEKSLRELSKEYDIIIYTTRKNKDEVKDYIKDEIGIDVEVTNEKPLAEMYIDDRAINFDGNWKDTLDEIKEFKPYLDRKSLKQFKPKIEVNLWNFDDRTSYDFKIMNPDTNDEIAHLQTDEFEKGKEHGIFDIEVNPKYRRQGVATKLFDYAKNYLKQIGIQLIHSNNLSPEGMSWKQSLGNLYNFN